MRDIRIAHNTIKLTHLNCPLPTAHCQLPTAHQNLLNKFLCIFQKFGQPDICQWMFQQT